MNDVPNDHRFELSRGQQALYCAALSAGETFFAIPDRPMVTGGRPMTGLRATMLTFYGVLIWLALWWLWLGHPLFTWDTLLWIGGFKVIEMNLRAWRKEIAQRQGEAPATTPGAGERT